MRNTLQRFLGVINYYRNHVPSLALHAAPLYALLNSNAKFVWLETHSKAFSTIKELASARIPLHPINVGDPFHLYTDASSVAIGAVLKQDNQIVGFFSHKLNPAEQRYPTFDREALAVVSALKHFKYLLLRSPVSVFPDHKPLLSRFQRPPVSGRPAPWLGAIPAAPQMELLPTLRILHP